MITPTGKSLDSFREALDTAKRYANPETLFLLYWPGTDDFSNCSAAWFLKPESKMPYSVAACMVSPSGRINYAPEFEAFREALELTDKIIEEAKRLDEVTA